MFAIATLSRHVYHSARQRRALRPWLLSARRHNHRTFAACGTVYSRGANQALLRTCKDFELDSGSTSISTMFCATTGRRSQTAHVIQLLVTRGRHGACIGHRPPLENRALSCANHILELHRDLSRLLRLVSITAQRAAMRCEHQHGVTVGGRKLALQRWPKHSKGAVRCLCQRASVKVQGQHMF